jgi:hypothetical protein
VGTVDPQTGEAVIVPNVLLQTFEDGLPIATTRIQRAADRKRYTLLRQGGDEVRSRSKSNLVSDRSGALYIANGATSESAKETRARIATLRREVGFCKHTITRTSLARIANDAATNAVP